MRQLIVISVIFTSLVLSACIARKEVILPTRYDRIMLVDLYKGCVKRTTTNYYDDRRTPEAIVQASLAACKGRRQAMLRDYPRRWHAGLLKEIDEDLYKEEIAWIENKRR